MTSKIIYQGNLRTVATHLASGESIVTDAPLDNQGKGEAFSPTDLFATSLASCALTIMGIAARTHQINMDGTTAEVLKTMSPTPPRRVAGIDVVFRFAQQYTEHEQKILIQAAKTCPISLSLSPDIAVNLQFEW